MRSLNKLTWLGEIWLYEQYAEGNEGQAAKKVHCLFLA